MGIIYCPPLFVVVVVLKIIFKTENWETQLLVGESSLTSAIFTGSGTSAVVNYTDWGRMFSFYYLLHALHTVI